MGRAMKINIATGIHNGDVTHHQDQSATTPICASFIIRNTMKTNPKRPTPPEEELLLLLLIIIQILVHHHVLQHHIHTESNLLYHHNQLNPVL